MVKVGDKLIMKSEVALENNITGSDREFTITELRGYLQREHGFEVILENKSGEVLQCDFNLKYFDYVKA